MFDGFVRESERRGRKLRKREQEKGNFFCCESRESRFIGLLNWNKEMKQLRKEEEDDERESFRNSNRD